MAPAPLAGSHRCGLWAVRSSCSWERGPWLHHLRTCFRVILPCCHEITCTTSIHGANHNIFIVFFSVAMLRSTFVRSSSLDFLSFNIMNHRYHFVGSALLSRTAMDITHQQKSEKNVWRLRIKSKQFTLYSYIPTSPAFTVCRKSFTHHWVGFFWWSQWLAPALVLPKRDHPRPGNFGHQSD